MLTSIIEKAKTLKNKEQILNYLYKMYYKENERILSDFESRQMLKEIKANNFGLVGKELPINAENLLLFGFESFHGNIFIIEKGKYTTSIEFFDEVNFSLEIIIDTKTKHNIELFECKIKNINELLVLIYQLTSIQIKPI